MTQIIIQGPFILRHRDRINSDLLTTHTFIQTRPVYFAKTVYFQGPYILLSYPEITSDNIISVLN